MPGPDPSRDGLWSPARRTLTLGLVLTITLVASESLAISTAMPLVAKDLGGLELYGWVFSAFFLGSLVGIAVVGGLIDERGLVQPFAGGLVLFGAGLLIGGLAPSMPVLVAARFLQGLGAGAVQPVAYVAIGRALPERLRPQMFAMLSAAWVLPGVFGPAIAGFVAQTFHWRWVFLGLLPLIVMAGAIALRALLHSDAEHDARIAAVEGSTPTAVAEHRRRLVLACGLAIGGGLITAGLQSPDLPIVVGLTGAGMVLTLVAFHPLAPAGTFRLARGYPAAVVLRGLLTFTFFCLDAYVPLLLVEVHGWSAASAGIALTGATITWSLGSWIQSRLSQRLGPERLVTLGFPVVGLGLAGLGLTLVPGVPAILAVPTFALAGLGMGLTYSQFAVVVLRDAPADAQGSVTAALSLSDGFGTAIGNGATNAFLATGARTAATTAAGVTFGLSWAVGLAVVGAVLGLALSPRLRHARAGVAEGGAPAPVR